MQPEQQQRIMGYFIEEAKEHLNTIEQGLLSLQSTIEDAESINEVFRAAHSVKGGAAMLGLGGIQQVSHRLEDFFKILKESPVQVDQRLETLFLQVFDVLKELLEQLQSSFGLSDAANANALATVEPVFIEIEQWLAQATGAGTAAGAPATLGTVSSARSLVEAFQTDVPGRLREMLQLFKQAETAENRQRLCSICATLRQQGEPFSLTDWCHLIEMAERAIAHSENRFRDLAPVVIRDIKQAQELVLANRASEIAPCDQLIALVPIVEVHAPATSDTSLEDLLTAEAAATTDVFDFDESEPNFEGDALSLAGFPSGSIADSLHSIKQTDVAHNLDEADSPQGPEVGLAELNSLADLFEGEMPELGSTWQNEEILHEENDLSLDVLPDLTDSEEEGDFSDLLFESSHPGDFEIQEFGELGDLGGLFEEMESGDAASVAMSASETGASAIESDHVGSGLEDLLTLDEADLLALDTSASIATEAEEAELFGDLDLETFAPDALSQSDGTTAGESLQLMPEADESLRDLGELFAGIDATGFEDTAAGSLPEETVESDFTNMLSEQDELADLWEDTAAKSSPDTGLAGDAHGQWPVSELNELAADAVPDPDADTNLDDLLAVEAEANFESSDLELDLDLDLADFGNTDSSDLGDVDLGFGEPERDISAIGTPDPWLDPASSDAAPVGLDTETQMSVAKTLGELDGIEALENLETDIADETLWDTAIPGSETLESLESLDDFESLESLESSDEELEDLESGSANLGLELSDFDGEASSQLEADLFFEELETASEGSGESLTHIVEDPFELTELTPDADGTEALVGSDASEQLDDLSFAVDAVGAGLETDELFSTEMTSQSDIDSEPMLLDGNDEVTFFALDDSLDDAGMMAIDEPATGSLPFEDSPFGESDLLGLEGLDDASLNTIGGELELDAAGSADALFGLEDAADDLALAFDAGDADAEATADLLGNMDVDSAIAESFNPVVSENLEQMSTLDSELFGLESLSGEEVAVTESLGELDSLDLEGDFSEMEPAATPESLGDFDSLDLEGDLSAFDFDLAAPQDEESSSSFDLNEAASESALFSEPDLDVLTDAAIAQQEVLSDRADDDASFGEATPSSLEPDITADFNDLEFDELDLPLGASDSWDDDRQPSAEASMLDFDQEFDLVGSLDKADMEAEQKPDQDNWPSLSNQDLLSDNALAAEAEADLEDLLSDEWANVRDQDSELNDLDNLLAASSEDLTDTLGTSDISGELNDFLEDNDLNGHHLFDLEDATSETEETSSIDDSFADLESLLADDAQLAAAVQPSVDSHQDLDAFADLEALLQPEADEQPEVSATSSDRDFDELDDLLRDAEEKMGGSASVKSLRGSPARPSRPARPQGEQTMRVPVKHLDNLSNLVGELVVNRNSLEQDQERLRQSLDNLLYQVQKLSDVGQRMQDLYERSLLESSLLASRQKHRDRIASSLGLSVIGADSASDKGDEVEYDPLEMDRFTRFHSLSQEMIELIVRVRESSSDIGFIVDETDQVTRMFRQVTTQLQEGLTRSRMMPFAQTADRLPRAVRDISIKVGKQAELIIEGRETLIDKMILEKLYDPLTHLVNNALTHGIESPEIRQSVGKSAIGRITVRAFHQGNQTVISVSDDGAGIDTERVKQKAIEKGLISAAEAQSLTRLDVYDLLFHPGFSTADQVSEFSGRGVGMDVVRTSLSEIRGVINTDSTPGKGTSFTIRLPLTLSISKALCCISDRARIAFPMDGVEDMLDLPKGRVQVNEEGQQCIAWRDTILPLRPLSELLTYNRHLSRGTVYGGHQEDDIVSIVVLRSAGNYLALQVDQVLGEQEIVIKQLEGPVPKPIGVAGATVLGDGRIMPIADVLELIDFSMGRIRKDAGTSLWDKGAITTIQEAPTVKTEPMVLIVDDSITVRELLSMTFNKVGYRVEQARDGQEAWEKLRSGLPCDIVFCDIEMPRMDGLDLLSRIQKDPTLSHLPIAMLTSRGADRHRQMAASLGASGYFTKPYLEEALLDAAQRMLKGEKLL